MRQILISAAEPSGDVLGAELVKAMKDMGDVTFYGLAGPKMRAAGVDAIAEMEEMSAMGDVKEKVLEFLVEEVDLDADELIAETSLFNSGLIDSVAVLSTVQFIEETFDFELEPEQVNLENFDSVSAIVALVQSRLA